LFPLKRVKAVEGRQLQETETAVMKSNTINSLLGSAILSSAIALGLFASTASAGAQTNPRVNVVIPFAFQVGSTQMPAGTYDVHIRMSHTVVQLQEWASGKQASALGLLLGSSLEGGKMQGIGRLIFHRYGNRYFLREVWDGDSMGVGCAPSKDERHILLDHGAETRTQLAFNVYPKR
jgi:hypothetical protein